MSGPTFGPQFDINEAAVRYFMEATAGNWIVRDRKPDVFVDFEVELRSPAEPTGKTCYVQLKGQRDLDHDDFNAKVVMSTKHLSYYLTKARQPVFLVVVDTKNRRAYYLFIQKWLEDTAAATRFESQDSQTVLVPLSQELENYPQFLAALERALADMADRYPGRPEAAVAQLEAFYRQLDERFDVDVSATSSGRRITVSSRGAAELDLNVGVDREAFPAIRERLDWGKPIFANVKVAIRGSPLFDELCAKPQDARIALKPDVLVEARFELRARLNRKVTYLEIPAVLTAGPKGAAVESTDTDCPLHIDLQIPWTKEGGPIAARLNSSIRVERWTGKTLSVVSRYHALVKFAEAVAHGAHVTIQAIGPQRHFEFTLPAKEVRWPHVKEFAWWFRVVADAAAVAGRYGLVAKVPHPEKITNREVAAISAGVDSLTANFLRRPWVQLALLVDQPAVASIVADIEKNGSVVGTFNGVFPFLVRVFGAEREVGMVEIGPTTCRLEIGTPEADEAGMRAIRVHKHPKGVIQLNIRREPVSAATFELTTQQPTQTNNGTRVES